MLFKELRFNSQNLQGSKWSPLPHTDIHIGQIPIVTPPKKEWIKLSHVPLLRGKGYVYIEGTLSLLQQTRRLPISQEETCSCLRQNFLTERPGGKPRPPNCPGYKKLCTEYIFLKILMFMDIQL